MSDLGGLPVVVAVVLAAWLATLALRATHRRSTR